MFTFYDRVTPSRVGADGKLKHISAIDLLQDCSLRWLESEPDLDKYTTENECGLFLMYRQVDFLRRLKLGENLTVSTGLFEVNRVMGKRKTFLFDENKQPCVKSWCIGGFADLKANRLTKLDSSIAATIKVDDQGEMECLPHRIEMPDNGYESLPPVPVFQNDIDIYNHVNNVRYIERAMQYLPHGFDIKRLRIEFKNPAKLGDSFYPKRLLSGNKYYIILSNEDGLPYITTEFEPV